MFGLFGCPFHHITSSGSLRGHFGLRVQQRTPTSKWLGWILDNAGALETPSAYNPFATAAFAKLLPQSSCRQPLREAQTFDLAWVETIPSRSGVQIGSECRNCGMASCDCQNDPDVFWSVSCYKDPFQFLHFWQ